MAIFYNYIHKLIRILFLIIGFILWTGFLDVQAQTRKPKGIVHDTLSVKERISFHTNAIDWLLLTPNLGIEFDLSNMDYGRNTLLFTGKWNGNSKHTFKPSWVYNRMELRGEFRHYFRTEPGGSLPDKASLKDRFDYLVGKKKEKPRIWRAYYWGAYGSYGDYSIKLGKKGKQGVYASAGVSFGFGMPLYTYRKTSLDFELGGSLGFLFTRYDAYTYDKESNCYPLLPEESKNWHIVPFPIPTDLHVSFVYRFHSIKNKYKAINYERLERQQALKAARIARRDSINILKKAEEDAKKAKKDSIQAIKDAQKEAIRMKIEATKDSLRMANLPTDSIQRMELLKKYEEEKAEKLRKQQEKEAKEKARLEKKEKEKQEKDKKKKKKEEEEVAALKPKEEKMKFNVPTAINRKEGEA